MVAYELTSSVLTVFSSCRWPETATFVLMLDNVLLLTTVAFVPVALSLLSARKYILQLSVVVFSQSNSHIDKYITQASLLLC